MLVVHVGVGLCLIALAVCIILVAESFRDSMALGEPHEPPADDYDPADFDLVEYSSRKRREVEDFESRHWRV